MDMEELRKVLRLVCSKQPSFILDILDAVGVMVQGNQGLKEGLHQAGVSALCRNMPTDREGVCCGKSRENCQSRLPVSMQLFESPCI